MVILFLLQNLLEIPVNLKYLLPFLFCLLLIYLLYIQNLIVFQSRNLFFLLLLFVLYFLLLLGLHLSNPLLVFLHMFRIDMCKISRVVMLFLLLCVLWLCFQFHLFLLWLLLILLLLDSIRMLFQIFRLQLCIHLLFYLLLIGYTGCFVCFHLAILSLF